MCSNGPRWISSSDRNLNKNLFIWWGERVWSKMSTKVSTVLIMLLTDNNIPRRVRVDMQGWGARGFMNGKSSEVEGLPMEKKIQFTTHKICRWRKWWIWRIKAFPTSRGGSYVVRRRWSRSINDVRGRWYVMWRGQDREFFLKKWVPKWIWGNIWGEGLILQVYRPVRWQWIWGNNNKGGSVMHKLKCRGTESKRFMWNTWRMSCTLSMMRHTTHGTLHVIPNQGQPRWTKTIPRMSRVPTSLTTIALSQNMTSEMKKRAPKRHPPKF